ncbi:hypothetical protein GCM10022254_26850 [Actinomadura meridiana]|uniref:Secreted protein n=1 Tax=Actinomadura meridiana TaxID=559626 RepID=A0ABP8BZG8_9ACTN
MALPNAVTAFLARRLVISLTCLLARRRAAAFAGVGVHFMFAPPPARRPVASLTEGTLAPTSGTFAQIGVYFLGLRAVFAHAGGLVGVRTARAAVPWVTSAGWENRAP